MKDNAEKPLINKKCLEDELRVIKGKIRDANDEEKKALLSFRRMAKLALETMGNAKP